MPVNWKVTRKLVGSEAGLPVPGEFAMMKVEIKDTEVVIDIHAGYSNQPCNIWIELNNGRPVVRLYSPDGNENPVTATIKPDDVEVEFPVT